MSFVNTGFFIFLAAALAGYYIMNLIKPIRKYQWVWLLAVSYYYYLSFGFKTLFFILFTTLTTYTGAVFIGKAAKAGKEKLAAAGPALSREEKKALKAVTKRNKRIITALVLLANFGMLAGVKYMNFFIDNLNSLFHAFGGQAQFSVWSLMLPIGISFYTFQSMGYLIDVYQGKFEPEKNPLKFALFVSFFPQILQGPIGRFNKLAVQLYENHRFDLARLEYALQLIGWGLFKKMVLADRASVYVNTVFTEYYRFCGFYNIVAVLLYTVQLYADFSGGMDIVMGVAEAFGIRLDQNFRQPFFSKSISEFWRRWHITLGTWMKDYVFYPFSLSKPMNKFGKFTKRHLGTYLGKTLPICLANLLIFFLVGIWHGAAWKFIAYGMYNGVIIAFSNLMEPVYAKGIKALHINAKSRPWKGFQIFRTFVLINIGWFFDMGVSFTAAIQMMKDTVYQINFAQLTDGTILGMGMGAKDFAIIGIGCLVWLVISILKERGVSVREAVARCPLPVRWALYLALIFSTPLLGYIGPTSGFIYAQF